MFSKHRKHKREVIARDCAVESYLEKRPIHGTVTNISEGGAGLDLEKVPRPDEEIIVHMRDMDGREIARKGVVIWFIQKTPPEKGAVVGVKFVS